MATERNPFDLEGRGGPDRPHPKRVWTPAEQAKKLAGYLEVPPEYWPLIKYGTHVRYYTKDGEYRPGGFVLKNPLDVKPRGAEGEVRYMKFQNGFDSKERGYAQWLAAYEETARIFVKPEAGVLVMMQNLEAAVRGLNENIRKLAEHSKKLEQRVAALEQQRR